MFSFLFWLVWRFSQSVFSPKTATCLEQRLSLNSLTKHMFVAGVPGSGKTTAVFNMLVQLARNGVPFLVIEPAKTEYRALKMLGEHADPAVRGLAGDLRIYSPGNDNVSPLRFNPFAYPEGITLDEHISQVLACFEAAKAGEMAEAARLQETVSKMRDIMHLAPTLPMIQAVLREQGVNAGYPRMPFVFPERALIDKAMAEFRALGASL